jgi:hypothetical protein
MTSTDYGQPTAEQQQVLDDAAVAIMRIKNDAVAKVAAMSGFDFDGGWFGSPCRLCECRDFVLDSPNMSKNPNCLNTQVHPVCTHKASDHMPT